MRDFGRFCEILEYFDIFLYILTDFERFSDILGDPGRFRWRRERASERARERARDKEREREIDFARV